MTIADPPLALRAAVGAGKRRWVLITVLWANLGVWLDSAKTSLLTPYWAGELGLDAEQIASVSSAYLLGYFPTLFIAGFLADRIGPKKMLIICLSGVTVMGFTMAAVQTYNEMYWRNLIFGVFFGFLWAPCQRLLAVWFPVVDTPKVTGLWVGSTMIAAVVAPLVALPIAINVDWRWSFIVISLIGLPALLLLIFKTSDVPARLKGITQEEVELIGYGRSEQAQAKLPAREILRYFKKPSVLFMCLAAGLATTPTWLIGTWTSYGLITLEGVNANVFTYVAPLASLIPVLYSFVHGRFVNKAFKGRLKPAMLLGVGIAALGYLLAAVLDVPWFIWLVLISAFGFMANPLFWGSLNAYWVRIARPEATGTLNGIGAGLQVAFGYIMVSLSANWLQPEKEGLSQTSNIWLIGAAVFAAAAIPVLFCKEPAVDGKELPTGPAAGAAVH
jgi:MFS family permease